MKMLVTHFSLVQNGTDSNTPCHKTLHVVVRGCRTQVLTPKSMVNNIKDHNDSAVLPDKPREPEII